MNREKNNCILFTRVWIGKVGKWVKSIQLIGSTSGGGWEVRRQSMLFFESLRLLVTTDMLLMAMASAARMG